MTRSKESTPSKDPCHVCGAHDRNRQWIFGFRYTLCDAHREVPPLCLNAAKQQYVRHRRTEWDASPSDYGRADPNPGSPKNGYGDVPEGIGITKRSKFFDV